MSTKVTRIILPMLVILSLLIGACGGSEPDAPPTKAPSEKDTEVKQPSVDQASVTSLEDVRLATVRIEAEGTFVDPQDGMTATWAGSGSGFVIDPSGIAVTNNHVVTGAALLRVWVADETSPRNARILGVSECADLAVIDIDGPDLSYLDWHQGEVNVGLEVYAAGFPLGDPEFTLTKGIVSKANADGESTWSSIDYVIEHDARINPGNSGGPLVDEDGRVVAVNYASLESANQYFAIKADDALPVIEQLRQGNHVDSIGVNGSAFVSGDGSFSGIWVYSVESGSPADEAGISGGDIITNLEGLPLSTDGTMSDYCDILRTQGADDTLGVEIFRYASGETLEGQLNGRHLSVSGTTPVTGGSSGGSTGGSYITVNDDQYVLQVDIPASWTDVDGTEWSYAGEAMGPSLWAAPDLSGFLETWNTPGMKYNITTQSSVFGGPTGYLDLAWETFSGQCDYLGREAYDDGLFFGEFDGYENCGGTNTEYVVLAVNPVSSPGEYMIIVEIQMVSDADRDAAVRIFDTFNVLGFATGGGTATDDGGLSGGNGSFQTITDDYNSIVVDVPSTWDQIDGRAWEYNGEIVGAWVTAAPDLEGYNSTWDVPGMDFRVSDDLANQLGYIELLNDRSAFYRDSCDYDGRYDYDDGYYRGKADYFNKCGGSGGPDVWLLSAVSKSDQFAYLILVEVVILSDADWDAVDQIVASFDVIDQLP